MGELWWGSWSNVRVLDTLCYYVVLYPFYVPQYLHYVTILSYSYLFQSHCHMLSFHIAQGVVARFIMHHIMDFGLSWIVRRYHSYSYYSHIIFIYFHTLSITSSHVVLSYRTSHCWEIYNASHHGSLFMNILQHTLA